MTIDTRAVRFGTRAVPVVLPNRRDARLHTSAVIFSVHAVGITALGFRVSVPQVAIAIVTAAVIDAAWMLRDTGKLVWPASGILTGSGVALILRLVGMPGAAYWSWTGWHWFALVAAVSILSKHLIRFRGEHVFNPSNFGLVAAFLLLGSGVVEPLDFWWAPLDFWMVAAYALIVGGGILITRRLHLLEMAVVFWVVLAMGLAVLSASGHCMVATWSTSPVCGDRFWTTLVTSPEMLIFLFFMITDPKTIPSQRGARVVFAASLALFATLMIAPHAAEYGAKVGLLGSLVVWSPLRWAFRRVVVDDDPGLSGLLNLAHKIPGASKKLFLQGAGTGAALVMVAAAIVAAGTPSRDTAVASTPTIDFQADIDPSLLPEVVIDASVGRLDIASEQDLAKVVAVTLAENLAIEGEALRTANGSLLSLASGGARLEEMQRRLDTAIATGDRWVDEYTLATLTMGLHEAAEGQASAGLVLEATGVLDRVLYDADGIERSREDESFRADFVLRQLAGERWLIVAVLTPP